MSLRYLPKGVQGVLLCWTPRSLPVSVGGAWPCQHCPSYGTWEMLCVCIICMHTRVLCLASVFSLPNTPSQPVAIPCALTLGMPHAQGWLPSVHLSVHPGTASSAEPPYAHPQSSVNVYTGILESRAGLTPGEGFLVPRWALGAAKTSILLRAKIGAADERGGFGAYNVSVEAQCWGGRAPLWTLGIRYEAPSPPAWLWHREGGELGCPCPAELPPSPPCCPMV